MLTWADIAKLCVPFIFSLILIWAKHSYDTSRERKAKQEFLWRTINQGLVDLPVALGELDKLADAFKNNRVRIVDFDLAANLTDFGNRLGELILLMPMSTVTTLHRSRLSKRDLLFSSL